MENILQLIYEKIKSSECSRRIRFDQELTYGIRCYVIY
jgi:hypothetical protein